MQTLNRKWNCYHIAQNAHYIATIGTGVSIWDRSTLELLHHFEGFRYLHGGEFVTEDILAVYTGEQKLYFLQISQKKVLWAVPRPRELCTSGDIRCRHIPGTQKVACIARGKKGLEEHFLMIADCATQSALLWRLAGCYRVVKDLVWIEDLGLAFLSFQASEKGSYLQCRIHEVEQGGNMSIILEKDGLCNILGFSGRYLFVEEQNHQSRKVVAYPLDYSKANNGIACSEPFLFSLTPKQARNFLNEELLPKICWIDEAAGMLAVCDNYNSVGVYDFRKDRKLVEYRNEKAWCAEILDGQLFIGGCPGFYVQPLEDRKTDGSLC